ncbi:MAG: Crp/Fnr family transcriptional regulator [Bacteroidetes bacterium]|nr:Crp/Fnr family transcriptional regulator [Bacteroidota bacterium]
MEQGFNDLLEALSGFAELSSEARKAIEQLVTYEQQPKNTLLLEQGKVCRQLYFLQEGFVRGYYFLDGKDVTTWFAFKGDIFTSMYSFLSGQPSLESIEILEESRILEIDSPDLQHLYNCFPEFNQVGRLLMEKYYLELEERAISLQHMGAGERYQALLLKHPTLLQKATLGQIASFLGMSQETLSRIRAKY